MKVDISVLQTATISDDDGNPQVKMTYDDKSEKVTFEIFDNYEGTTAKFELNQETIVEMVAVISDEFEI